MKSPDEKSRRRMPNIYDVARAAGVSVFTVSAVVNRTGQVSDALRQRVEAAIQKLRYRPNLLARGLATRQTRTIGVVVPDIANPFFPLVVRGAEDAVQRSGFSLLLCNSDDQKEKEQGYLELLVAQRVDGILLTKTPAPFSPQVRQLIKDTNTLVVLMMRTIRGFPADAVITDDVVGAYEAVTHLARIGHRRIAIVGGPAGVSNAQARFRGYRKALADSGLRFEPALTGEGDYRIESGYRAGLKLLPRRPDAVFVTNYLMTVGFMQAADEMRLQCPQDFGLVSFDDYPWLGSFHPRLTTVELPKYEVGEAAAQILLQRIEKNGGRPILRKLAPQLRVRESCGFSHCGSGRQLARSERPSSTRAKPSGGGAPESDQQALGIEDGSNLHPASLRDAKP
jgi:DNA-binding LacI/PurR family transcriptional regulator